MAAWLLLGAGLLALVLAARISAPMARRATGGCAVLAAMAGGLLLLRRPGLGLLPGYGQRRWRQP
ncbi:hypothetical protein [Falsiroseomonas sp. CW058]|uniref:hypothetical protein n=1 Tax=Falsiroseomonas sp. CW058 TaxID=3388664 RepID=UPI003D31756E